MNTALLRAFLDDCKAQPDDDTPRLILADWLQEHGDTEAERARGEFVRLQVRLAHRDLIDEDATERADRARAWELLRRHKAEWVGDLAELGLVDFHLRRGLVEAGCPMDRLDGRLLDHLGRSPQWPWIEGFTAVAEPGDGGLQDPADWLLGLPADSALEDVPDLAFEIQAFGERHAAALGGWPGLGRLHTLAFYFCAVLDRDLPLLLGRRPLPNLRRLRLDFYNATAAGIAPVLRPGRIDGIEHLYLAWQGDDLGPLDRLGEMPFRTRLKSLGLGDAALQGEGLARLARLDLPALRELRLVNCELDEVETSLAPASWLGQVETLEFGGEPLDGLLPLLGRLPRVRELRISWDGIDTDSLADLASSPELPALRSLGLGLNSLHDEEVDWLIDHWRRPDLRVLDLHNNDLTDDAAIALAAWTGVRHLHRLDLSRNEIGEVGLRHLVESPHLPPWAEIDLRHCAVNVPADEVARLGRPVLV